MDHKSPKKVHVTPWGSWDAGCDDDTVNAAAAGLREEFHVPGEAQVLLTLSRISPEKGQDRLLEALIEQEKSEDRRAPPLWVFICGAPAYMQGIRFQRKLTELASRLKKTKVVFPGHVTGVRKRAFFALADLYVFPSRHESYGLTLLEALAAGLPAVCVDHDGARTVMRPDFGELVAPKDLGLAIARLLSHDNRRQKMSAAARKFACGQSFSACAARLADLLLSAAATRQSGLRSEPRS